MAGPASRHRLVVLISLTTLGVVAFGSVGAGAGPVGVGSVRIGPSVGAAPYADNLGGGVGAHTDRVWGHPDGGSTAHTSCVRRTDQRHNKRQPRRQCGDDN